MKALVTGGEAGLGAGIVARLAESHDVIIMPGAVIRRGEEAIDEFIHDEDFDGLTVVVNNFGINHLSWIGETDPTDAEIVAVNLLAPYWVINSLVAHGHGPARVINIASQTYRIAQRTTALYCASKAGLVQMGRVMARELAPQGWIVNTLAPGKITDTEMARLTDAQVLSLRHWTIEEAERYSTTLVPMGRYTSVAEVSAMVMLMLDMPDYVNGSVIDMMGGV